MTTAPGVCRYCRCTEANACRLPEGDTCWWINAGRDVCSNPACIRRLYADKAIRDAELRRRTRKRTPAEIHALKLEEARQKRAQYREAAKARRKQRGVA